jgi:hypothetical protein
MTAPGTYSNKSASDWQRKQEPTFPDMTMQELTEYLPKMNRSRDMRALQEKLAIEIRRIRDDELPYREKPGGNIEWANKLKAEMAHLTMQYDIVTGYGDMCNWTDNCVKWQMFLDKYEGWFKQKKMDWLFPPTKGGKRRSKSSNKPKKSAKRAKSRRTRRQRK